MARSNGASSSSKGRFPRLGFAILAAGGLWASGLYAGMIRTDGTSTGDLVAAIGFGLLGLIMLWGVVGRRR